MLWSWTFPPWCVNHSKVSAGFTSKIWETVVECVWIECTGGKKVAWAFECSEMTLWWVVGDEDEGSARVWWGRKMKEVVGCGGGRRWRRWWGVVGDEARTCGGRMVVHSRKNGGAFKGICTGYITSTVHCVCGISYLIGVQRGEWHRLCNRCRVCVIFFLTFFVKLCLKFNYINFYKNLIV